MLVTHLIEGVAYHNTVFAFMKQCGDLSFACQRHNVSKNVRDGMNGAVELGCGDILAFMFFGEEKMSPNAASSLGL